MGAGEAEGVLLLMTGNAFVPGTIAGHRELSVGLCLSCSDQSVKLLVHVFHSWIEFGEKVSNAVG